MVILSEVAQKLEKILNGVDTEVTNSNPIAYRYKVEAQGFHIDHILDKDTGTNFIPVFVSSMGGQFNPVAGLKQGTYTIPITFYFPVRFKNDFFKLGDFLIDVFVGKGLNFGTISGYGICNLSVPTFGEIQDLDLEEFQNWVEEKYQNRVGRRNEPFMSMTVNLYITNAGSDFMFGNSVTVSLTYGSTTEEITFADGSIQSQAQTSSEQELGATTPEADGLPFGTAYSSGFTAYIKNNSFWSAIIKDWCDGKAQTMEFVCSVVLGAFNPAITYSRTCYIESVNLPIQKGQLMTATFSFGKKVQEE